MPSPEIDRRCPDCGAAVRTQAAFCQQCGRPMKSAAASTTAVSTGSNSASDTAEPPKAKRRDAETDNATRPLASPPPATRASEPPRLSEQPRVSESTTAASTNPEAVSLPARIAREQIASGTVIEPPAPEGGARPRRMRVAAAAARDAVEERIAPRVEKLRQASNVVLDEAADDPNLRFILVAALLFVIALVLIFLSNYLK